MIISASRRTDIPAFYWDWFRQRIREKYLVTVNPFNKKQRTLVSLDPSEVEAIVFWTKDPTPCLDGIGELEKAGFRDKLFFQVTINPYSGTPLEAHLPPLARRIESILALARLIGRQHIVYRYDPILLARGTFSIDQDFHRWSFRTILGEVAPACSRVITSVVDEYRKSRVHFRRLWDELGLEVLVPDSATLGTLGRFMVEEAAHHDLRVYSCAEVGGTREVLARAGVLPGRCIDPDSIERHLPHPVSLGNSRKDPGQRPECGCARSLDIGAYSTCLARCAYCYATDWRIHPRFVDPGRDVSLEPVVMDDV